MSPTQRAIYFCRGLRGSQKVATTEAALWLAATRTWVAHVQVKAWALKTEAASAVCTTSGRSINAVRASLTTDWWSKRS